MHLRNKILLILSTFSSVVVSAAPLSLSTIFSKHMVIQRGESVLVWGRGGEGKTINVSINGHNVSAKVDEKETWQVTLPPMSAGGPYVLNVNDSDENIKVSDVLVGDVWVASGQSNMEWKVGWEINDWQKEIADSHFPKIRFFSVDTEVLTEPSDHIKGTGWKVASPNTVTDFSAAAWFFAKNSNRELNIPIGIIDSAVGGTPAEAWTPVDELLKLKGYRADAQDMLTNKYLRDQRIKRRNEHEKKSMALISSDVAVNTLGVHKANFNDNQWQQIDVPFVEPKSDVVWLRKKVQLVEIPKNASLFFGEITQFAKVYVNGELVLNKLWNDSAKIIELPKNLLRKGENIIALRATNNWDNKVKVGEKGKVWLNIDNNELDLSGKWLFTNTLEEKMPEVERISSWPTGLYNAMIHPLTRFKINGVIWYQGENNVSRASEYQTLFAGLIHGWRKQWGIAGLAFVYVQLASFLPEKNHPSESDLALLREQQTETLALANTAMVVTIDIGSAEDIHPKNKQEVGRRLWLAAKSISENNPNFTGPMFDGAKVRDDSSVVVTFNLKNPLIVKGKTLIGFELAGNDGVYFNAQAQIIDNNKVKVTAHNVPKPVSIRYAWADNSPANLYGLYNLPVIPFQANF